jgi:hypothetical protein
MPLFRALAKNMAASYFGKKAPYGFVMEVTLLYVFILWPGYYVLVKTWAADLYLIYKLEPKARVCISDKDRMRMF